MSNDETKTLKEILAEAQADAQAPSQAVANVPTSTAQAEAPVVTANANVIEMAHVSKWFPAPTKEDKNARIEVVNDINFSLPDSSNGEFLAVLGPSGCGKSTILSMLAGQSAPSIGTIKTFGEPVQKDNPYAVTVQQAYTTFDWRDVLSNVTLGLEIQKIPAKERKDIAMHYLEKVGLADRASAYPKELSGGMKQRVAIARALAMKPRLVLMDEPFGALDANIRDDMQQMLLNLWAEEKSTIFFITHDITEAVTLADRIIVLSPRPATILHDIAVPFSRPRTDDVKNTKEFLDFTHDILKILKNQDGSGSVRVSV